ncbi:hypothetical protein RI129_001599 [Pyrocoelia pectoralis]|uniref:Poly [ADP-ribose] polymerase n=1 Tax=Pyrocoelia pectoralis TaxID=417401 RepID=A0AAN7ZK40_9COLE
MDSIIRNFIPNHWSYDNQSLDDCFLVEIHEYESVYYTLKNKVSGNFNLGVERIMRVENAYLWSQYLLKKEEYLSAGNVNEFELFHDTSESNVDSIVRTNLDWRRASRVKYGHGVSFSPSAAYANRESSRSNGVDRALILAKVLVQNPQTVASYVQLPMKGYDTTVGNCGNVYVKYYDDEFYPEYIIYYRSKEQPRYYRRR